MELAHSRDGEGGDRSRRLIEVGAQVLSELDLEAVLNSVVEAARELTGARYAALGVLDVRGAELERFVHLGVDEEVSRRIGGLPRGRGVLGELISHPEPLRLADVEAHPHAYGFPPGHPPMHSFLGVPIKIRGEVYGNLYLTEKQGGGEFDEADEEAALTLSTLAGIAIENARLYTALSRREVEVERALRQAETSVDIANAVGGETDVERVLDLIVKRARALVEARTLVVLLRRGERLEVAARAGQRRREVESLAIPVEDAPGRLREQLGSEATLIVPLAFRGRALGALVALEREAGSEEFDAEDRRLLQAFAASAATAVATAQTVEAEQLQQRVEIAEEERQRWARELHDGTLQSLAAARILLAAALQSGAEGRAERVAAAAEEAVAGLEGQITELSRLINDLRPAPLERLGLNGALAALVDECAARGALETSAEIEIGGELGGDAERFAYRLAQESLNNVVKHAGATHASLRVGLAEGRLTIRVEDDGVGFDPAAETEGRGVAGMRERVALLGGELEITSAPGVGTTITATLPIGRPAS